MLARIQRFFDRHLTPAAADPETSEQAARCAAAALLLEMMHMDQNLAPVQQQAVMEAVRSSFGLSAAQADELIACAEQERADATDYHQFTSLINRHFDAAGRAALVERLWQVAYANQALCRHEEYLARKVAGLLHVPHSRLIAAKHRAETAARPQGDAG